MRVDQGSFLALLVRDCGQTGRKTDCEIFKMLERIHLTQVIDHRSDLTAQYKYDCS